MSWYAVRSHSNLESAVFTSWTDTKKFVRLNKPCHYRKFKNRELADAFARNDCLDAVQQALYAPRTAAFVLYTDAAKRGGCPRVGIGVVVDGKPCLSEVAPERVATNQSGELYAAVRGIRYCLEERGATVMDVFTDSLYTVKIFNDWMKGWKHRGWQTAGGTPVQNLEWVQELDRLSHVCDLRFVHVPGHSHVPSNVMADALANEALDLLNS